MLLSNSLSEVAVHREIKISRKFDSSRDTMALQHVNGLEACEFTVEVGFRLKPQFFSFWNYASKI